MSDSGIRTTEAEIAQVIEIDATIDMTPFMVVANELVTERCADAGYTDYRLQLIETWLAAHFYAMRDERASSEGAGGVSVSYLSSIGLGLKMTKQGQTAMLLDTAGGLAALSLEMEKGVTKQISIDWLGKEADEIEDE